MTPPGATTTGTLLGGRVRYTQPVDGYRTGIEPVLLAAAIPARLGQRVLEAGTGAGAALLCLAARTPGLVGAGIERDPTMAALARQNMHANAAPFDIIQADVAALPSLPAFDHILANPPWHDPASSRPPDPLRSAATHRGPNGLHTWIAALSPLLVPRGTFTLILPAVLVAEAIAQLHTVGLGRLTLLPLWPRTKVAAKIAIVHATHGTGVHINPGLVLHGEGNGYTNEADAILRGGNPLLP